MLRAAWPPFMLFALDTLADGMNCFSGTNITRPKSSIAVQVCTASMRCRSNVNNAHCPATICNRRKVWATQLTSALKKKGVFFPSFSFLPSFLLLLCVSDCFFVDRKKPVPNLPKLLAVSQVAPDFVVTPDGMQRKAYFALSQEAHELQARAEHLCAMNIPKL